MAAPSSAYNTLDVTFLSISHKVAKLTGKHNTLANAKLNFHLDKVIAQRDKSTGALLGFVGVVRANGANAAWRSAARLSDAVFTDKDDGTDYLLLLDAGLNIQGYSGNPTVKYAFGNYFKIQLPVYGAPYEGCTYVVKMALYSSGESSMYNTSGSVGQDASVTATLLNRGGMTYFDEERTIYIRAEVTNGEGTRVKTNSVRMLAPMNFNPFVPVASYGDTPQKNDEGLVTLLVDSALEADIYEAMSKVTAPSLPSALVSAEGSPEVMLLGEGNVSGKASDSALESFYKAVTAGSTSWDKPDNGYWVNITGRSMGTQWVYYGVQIQSGRIVSVFRARTPSTVLPTITLVINVSKVSGETNKYQITFSLTASSTPSKAVTVKITALQLRKTQTGSSMTGTFTNMNGSVFNGRTLSIGGSGISLAAAPAYLVTSLATPFWVTATATCDSGSYQFVNKGGSTAESSGGITPVNPGGGLVQV